MSSPNDVGEDEFWQQPLASWMKNCICGCDPLIPETAWRSENRVGAELRFTDVSDGYVFNLLYVFVESDTLNMIAMRDVNARTTYDTTTRLKQFLMLLNNMQNFHRRKLNRLIVMPLPDLLNIVRNAHPDGCAADMNKVLLLLLGCAVQGEQREKFIERIKRMENDLQEAIAHHIRRITEDGEFVLNVQALELDTRDEHSAYIISHLERVMKERDGYASSLFEIANEHESDECSMTTGSSSASGELHRTKLTTAAAFDDRLPSPNLNEKLCNGDTLSIKAEIRRLRNIVEENEEVIVELREELETRDSDLLKLQQERLKLIKDARAANDYRDELDCLRHKITNFEKMEKENERLKKRLNDFDYFKSRTEQLKEENDLMHESCSVLEDQIEQMQKKISAQIEMEQKLADYQNQIKNYLATLSEERDKHEKLLIANGRIERELETERHNNAALLRKLDSISEPTSGRDCYNSLAHQLAGDDKKRILQLELENRKLRGKLECESEPEEYEKTKTELLRTEIELSQKTEQCEHLSEELREVHFSFSELTTKYESVFELCETLKNERNVALQNLQEARRSFSEFKSGFLDDSKSDLRSEVEVLNRSLSEYKERADDYLKEKVSMDEALKSVRIVQEHDLENHRQEANNLRIELIKLTVDHNNLMNDFDALNNRLERMAEETLTIEDQNRSRSGGVENELKKKLNLLEEKSNEDRMKLIDMANLEKRLAANERSLLEKQSVLCDFECENRQLKQRLELEIKKTDRFCDDLIAEKSRCSDLVSRLRSLCNTIQLNRGKIDIPEDDEQIIASIDAIILDALTTARREADALRLQQHMQLAELNDLRKDIEMLRCSENKILNESDDKVRELNAENTNVKNQVFLLQSKIHDLQAENAAKCGELVAMKRELEDAQANAANSKSVHTELAKLQVSTRNLQLQEELFKKDNIELQKQISLYERQRRASKSDLDTLQSMHSALLTDHNRLQTLHDLLIGDFERVKKENADLKTKMKTRKGNSDELLHMRTESGRDRRYMEELQIALADVKTRQEKEVQRLNTEIASLRFGRDRSPCSSDIQMDEIRNSRTEQANRTTINHLNAKIVDMNRLLQSKDVEIANLRRVIQTSSNVNHNGDSDAIVFIGELCNLIKKYQEIIKQIVSGIDCRNTDSVDLKKRLSILGIKNYQLEQKIQNTFHAPSSNFVRNSPLNRSLNISPFKSPVRTGGTETSVNGFMARENHDFSPDKRLSNGYRLPSTAGNVDHEIRPNSLNSPHARDLGHYVKKGSQDFDHSSQYTFSERSTTLLLPSNLSDEFVERISLCGSERAVDVQSPSSARPPKPTIRIPSYGKTTSTMRPPPPPYNPNRISRAVQNEPAHKPQPPSYPGSLEHASSSSISPKGSLSPKKENEVLANEGEERGFVRPQEERNEKAMSLYENVNTNETSGNTVWYEYGCV